MKTTIDTITPKRAAEWLKENKDNRPMRPTHVAFLVQEILQGRWRTTHQGIAFSNTGRLLDGQHRLQAIVQAGKAIQMSVSTGLEDDDFRAMDAGMKRSHSDRIHLVNDTHENRMICMAIRTFLIETSKNLGGSKEISVGMIEDEFLNKSEAWQWVGKEFTHIDIKLRKAGFMASFGVFHYVKPDKAVEFMTGFRSGAGLPEGSPILKLRADALMTGRRDEIYWRAQAIMRSYLHGKSLTKVYEAGEDMIGNSNSSRVVKARAIPRLKGAQTRKMRIA